MDINMNISIEDIPKEVIWTAIIFSGIIIGFFIMLRVAATFVGGIVS